MITYAKSNGPPAYWRSVEVIDLATGKPLKLCHEVNTVEGWAICDVTDSDGRMVHHGGVVETVRLEGRFAIRRKRG